MKIYENKPKIVRSTSSILHSPEMHVIRVNSMDCYSNHPKRTSSILSMLQLHAFVVLGRHHVAVDNSHTVRIQPEDWNQTPWCSQSRVKHAMQPSKSMVFYLSHGPCETWSSFRTLLCSGGYMLCDFQIAHDDSECVWCCCWWWWWWWWWWWMKVSQLDCHPNCCSTDANSSSSLWDASLALRHPGSCVGRVHAGACWNHSKEKKKTGRVRKTRCESLLSAGSCEDHVSVEQFHSTTPPIPSHSPTQDFNFFLLEIPTEIPWVAFNVQSDAMETKVFWTPWILASLAPFGSWHLCRLMRMADPNPIRGSTMGASPWWPHAQIGIYHLDSSLTRNFRRINVTLASLSFCSASSLEKSRWSKLGVTETPKTNISALPTVCEGLSCRDVWANGVNTAIL